MSAPPSVSQAAPSTASPAVPPALRTPRTPRRWLRRGSALLSAAVSLGLAGALGLAPQAVAAGVANSSTPAAISGVQQQVLFAAGTGGYGCYRIPALVRTADGSLLAFAEGRKTQSCGDRGDTDLVERRSTNDGRTWSPIRVVPSGDTAPLAYGTGPIPNGVQAGSPVTRTNPAPVVDLKHGRVYLLSTSNPVNYNTPRTPWVQESTDDGLSWTAPAKLNVPLATAPAEADWYATGPGHGVQLTAGPNKDRLVVGAHQKSGGGVFAGYLYLDPNAEDTATWKAAGAVDSHSAAAGGYSPSEVSVTEVSGGHVYAAARAEDISAKGDHRLGSTDVIAADGTTPSVPAFAPSTLPSPGNIQGSVLTVQQAGGGRNEEVLLSAPAGLNNLGKPNRTTMTVWTRCGGSWNAGKKISDGRAGYSDLALLADREIGLLYEGGSSFSAGEIRFTRFDQSQLGNGCNPPLAGTSHQTVPNLAATTPDASPQANDGYLGGAASLSSTDQLSADPDDPALAGVSDKNLALGAGDFVDVPYARSLRTGTGDFTYSMWFKYQAQTDDPDRILFWSYGTGSNKPQVWLRTQGGAKNQLYALAQSSGADQASVTLQDQACGCAFGDNTWHFVTLTRTGSQLSLQVDQSPAAAGTGAVTGDVADDPANDVLGIRVGAKPDSVPSNPFAGKIDEFRLYRGALTAAQRTSLATGATSGGRVSGSTDPLADDRANAGLVLRLPFQALDQTTPVSLTTVVGTDDESGHCTDGTLLGPKPATSAGRFTDALPVSAAVPGVSSPLTPALDVADRDFTYAMWFKFTASAAVPQRVLLWAYGPKPATAAQLWVQALYAASGTTLRAAVETDTNSTVTLDTPVGTNFGDGQWHGLTLSRQGGAVRLTVVSIVAGQQAVKADVTSATPLTGSLTGAKASGVDGVRLGSKPDGTKILDGDIDEFRLYDHALSTTEIHDADDGGLLSPTSGLTVRWSMDDKYVYSIPAHRAAPETTRATPDHSGWCNNAYVLNGGSIDPGGPDGTGTNLRLDGTTGTGALVPYSPSLALAPETVAPSTAPHRPGETSDFTVSLWFKYSSTASPQDQALLWAYGAGSAERQIWLRASPNDHGIWADVETGSSGTRVLAKDQRLDRVAFGDDEWHHLTLVRSGDSLTLAVDNLAETPVTLGDGAATATDTFSIDGFRLGGKPDGTQPLKGSLDEVRIYRQALSASDLTDLQNSTAPTDAAPVLWLPFDTITPTAYSRM